MDHIAAAFHSAPWWAYPTTIATAVIAAVLTGWLTRRAVVSAAAAVRRAATGSADQREQVAAFLRSQAMTLLFGVIIAIVIGLSARTMVGWLVSIGMTLAWARLGFVAFDGMATMLALTLWQRARRGESTGMIRPALWGLVGAAAYFNSHHAPDGNIAASLAYALFPVIAALGLEFLLQEQRRDREWLKEKAGEKARRRLALVRWLHPVERVRVMLEMATDEDMGAEEATARVRERTRARRQARAVRRVRSAVWRLRRSQAAARPRGLGWLVGWVESRRETRAQEAIAAARMAVDTSTVAAVLRELQMMTFASRFAAMDYSSAAEARRAMTSLITEAALEPLVLEAPGSPPVSAARPAVEPVPKAAVASGREPIRVVGGRAGRSMEQLQEELRAAVADGRITSNTVEAIYPALKIGKPRARALRDWAAERGLFESAGAAARAEGSDG